MTAIEFPIGGIDDGVVRLRLHADRDLERVAAASLDPEVLRWTRVPEGNDASAMAEWIGEWRSGPGSELHLVVVGADDDELLGAAGIVRFEQDERRCEIGYWLAREARGRGVATRAVRLLAGWIFASLEVDRIGIAAERENAASCAVAERAGFRFEGVLRSWLVIKGIPRDAAMYSLLRDEPPEPRGGSPMPS
ncbi:MAG: GNAT family N-acetyltransferase [Solirubrobacterales bacterium]|nr:GNAT family N-acetyltransferase [Solirubrobacterales bacterium]